MGDRAGSSLLRGAPGVALLAAAAAGLVVQFVGISIIPVDHDLAWVRRLIFLSTTVLAFAVAFRFRCLLGAWLVAGGIALNLAPIIAHGGLMPVAWETVRDSGDFPQITVDQVGTQLPGSKDILLLRDDIRFFAFSDRYALDAPLTAPHIYSPGDLVLFAGLALAVLEILAWVLLGTLPADRLLALART